MRHVFLDRLQSIRHPCRATRQIDDEAVRSRTHLPSGQAREVGVGFARSADPLRHPYRITLQDGRSRLRGHIPGSKAGTTRCQYEIDHVMIRPAQQVGDNRRCLIGNRGATTDLESMLATPVHDRITTSIRSSAFVAAITNSEHPYPQSAHRRMEPSV